MKALAYIRERAEIESWEALNRPAIVSRFRGLVSQASLYRWIDALRAVPDDAEAQPINRAKPRPADRNAARPPLTVPAIRRAAQGRPADAQRVAYDIKSRAADHLPTVPTVDEIAFAVSSVPLAVMEKIGACVQAAEAVMKNCRLATGEVRNAKLLLVATEALRRSLDTAVKLQEAVTDGLQVERFHAVILDEIGKIDPATAQRIVQRLQEVGAAWGDK